MRYKPLPRYGSLGTQQGNGGWHAGRPHHPAPRLVPAPPAPAAAQRLCQLAQRLCQLALSAPARAAWRRSADTNAAASSHAHSSASGAAIQGPSRRPHALAASTAPKNEFVAPARDMMGRGM